MEWNTIHRGSIEVEVDKVNYIVSAEVSDGVLASRPRGQEPLKMYGLSGDYFRYLLHHDRVV
jgi:hypothetical protein